MCGAEQRNEAILLRAAPRGKQKSKQVVIVFGRRRTDNGAEEEEEGRRGERRVEKTTGKLLSWTCSNAVQRIVISYPTNSADSMRTDGLYTYRVEP